MNRIVLAGALLLLVAGAGFAQEPELPPPATPRPSFQACFIPKYPFDALRREEEGMTTLAFRVPAGDAAPEVKVIRSSGSSSLDASALQMAGICLAKPGVRADLEPHRWYRQPVKWVLQ